MIRNILFDEKDPIGEVENESQTMRKHISKIIQKSEQLFNKAWKAASIPLTAVASSRHCNASLCPAGIFALAKLPCGICVIVRTINLTHDKAEQLRRIGIREGSRISLVSSHHPMLVVVENSRIALSHELAQHIRVQALFP